MKRTVEIILTIIGLLFSLAGTVLTGIMVFFSNSNTLRSEFVEGFNEGAAESGQAADPGDADAVLNVLISFGWIVFIACILGVIMGAIAIYLFAGNKKPKAASILMIITAVVVGIGTFLTGFLPALLYLIAGIVGLVRKKPADPQITEA